MKVSFKAFVSLGLVGAAFVQPYRPVVVMGTSMFPAFDNHQVLLSTPPRTEIERGDVVVFRLNGESVVKRVAFVPGDTIFQYNIGDEWRTPMLAKELELVHRDHLKTRNITIQPGELFVVGDNYNQSTDSRQFGPISQKTVIAQIPSAPREPIWKEFLGVRLSRQPLVAAR